MGISTLIRREVRQAKSFVWIVPLAHFLLLGSQRLNSWFFQDRQWLDRQAGLTRSIDMAYSSGGLESASRLMLMLLFFALALVQLGAERRNGTQEMLFSMPFSRRQIFASKWLFGMGLLGGSLLLNTAIDMAVMANSPVSAYFSFAYHAQQFGYSLLAVGACYSLALLIGTVCGGIASQSIMSAVALILPYTLLVVIDEFLNIHGLNRGAWQIWHDRIEDYAILVNYMLLPYDWFSWKSVSIMALLLVLAAFGGCAAYERNRAENNGKIVIFAACERLLQFGFVVCFALTSAMMVSGVIASQQMRVPGYYIGLAAGVCLSIVLTRRLTRLRLKI